MQYARLFMEVISVGSSSSGNSYIIKASGRAVILDVGLPCKTIMAALSEAGLEPEEVAAVLVTHEHTDHTKSVRAVSRKCASAVFYASRGTIESTAAFSYVPEERLHFVSAGESFAVGEADEIDFATDTANSEAGITVTAFSISHDAAEPISYTIEADGQKLAVVTDTGIVTDEIYEAIRDADLLVFESNHDEDMLMFGEYPYPVKVRIKGDRGHLSNDLAAEVLSRILRERKDPSPALGMTGEGALGITKEGSPGSAKDPSAAPLRIMLAHLSFHNNAPFFARQTVEDRLGSDGFAPGTDYVLEVALKEGLTYMP